MAKIHLIEGPVGADKCTLVAKLSKERAAPSPDTRCVVRAAV